MEIIVYIWKYNENYSSYGNFLNVVQVWILIIFLFSILSPKKHVQKGRNSNVE